MKGIILTTLGLLIASPVFAGEQNLNEELFQEIRKNCAFIQAGYFDIDGDTLEPVTEEASEEACYQSLRKLIQEDRALLLNEEQQEWYQEMDLEFGSLIDGPQIEDDYEDRPEFEDTENEEDEDITGRIDIEDDYEDDERPDFN